MAALRQRQGQLSAWGLDGDDTNVGLNGSTDGDDWRDLEAFAAGDESVALAGERAAASSFPRGVPLSVAKGIARACREATRRAEAAEAARSEAEARQRHAESSLAAAVEAAGREVDEAEVLRRVEHRLVGEREAAKAEAEAERAALAGLLDEREAQVVRLASAAARVASGKGDARRAAAAALLVEQLRGEMEQRQRVEEKLEQAKAILRIVRAGCTAVGDGDDDDESSSGDSEQEDSDEDEEDVESKLSDTEDPLDRVAMPAYGRLRE